MHRKAKHCIFSLYFCQDRLQRDGITSPQTAQVHIVTESRWPHVGLFLLRTRAPSRTRRCVLPVQQRRRNAARLSDHSFPFSRVPFVPPWVQKQSAGGFTWRRRLFKAFQLPAKNIFLFSFLKQPQQNVSFKRFTSSVRANERQ